MKTIIELREEFDNFDEYREYVVYIISEQTTYEECELRPRSIYELESILVEESVRI